MPRIPRYLTDVLSSVTTKSPNIDKQGNGEGKRIAGSKSNKILEAFLSDLRRKKKKKRWRGRYLYLDFQETGEDLQSEYDEEDDKRCKRGAISWGFFHLRGKIDLAGAWMVDGFVSIGRGEKSVYF